VVGLFVIGTANQIGKPRALTLPFQLNYTAMSLTLTTDNIIKFCNPRTDDREPESAAVYIPLHPARHRTLTRRPLTSQLNTRRLATKPTVALIKPSLVLPDP